MKIAIIGIRGIPFVYSGFEAFSEQFAYKMTKKNHQLTVYCRSNYFKNRITNYKGISLVYLPTIKSKSWETLIHSFLSTIHACFSHYDIVYYLGVASTVFSLIPRFFGIKTVVNIDGLDWKREKWSFFGKIFLLLSEWLSLFFPSKTITDSFFIKNYYKNKYHKEIDCIPYGYFQTKSKKNQLLKNFKLKKQEYFIWVGRIVPDNHLEEAVNAFIKLKTKLKLLVVGDNLYQSAYQNKINKISNQRAGLRIIFTGFLNHDDCVYLMKNSFAYIETKRSGGTHPSLIDAMASGCLIISNNHPANQSIIRQAGFYYDRNHHAAKNLFLLLKKIISTNKTSLSKKRSIVKKIAKKNYQWNKIIKQYEDMFYSILDTKKSIRI